MKTKHIPSQATVLALVAGTSLCLISSASAALVYVDATNDVGGNTINFTTGSHTDWYTTADNTGDNLWRTRDSGPANVAFGVTAYQLGVNENIAIQTTVGGLLPNTTYTGMRLYAIGHSNNSPATTWPIAASIDGTNFTVYADIPDASAHPVDTSNGGIGLPVVGSNDTRFWTALPDATTDASGNLSVWVNGPGTGNRTVYDGFAYESVPVPEPSGLALLALGALGAVARRRR